MTFINPASDVFPPFGRNLQTLLFALLSTFLWRGPTGGTRFGSITGVYLYTTLADGNGGNAPRKLNCI
jgi:hypothetical protein